MRVSSRLDSVDVIYRLRSRLLPYRRWLLLGVDLASWLLGFVATARISLGPNGAQASFTGLFAPLATVVVVQLVIGHRVGLYSGKFRVGGYDEVVAVAYTWAAVAVATSLLELSLSPDDWLAETPALFRSSVALACMALARVTWRRLIERALRPEGESLTRVVVVGAGEAGYLLVRGMLTDPTSEYMPIALLDEDPTMARRTLMGVQVEGTIADLPAVVTAHHAGLVIIAIPSASSKLIGEVVDQARTVGVEVRTLPPASELVGAASLRDVRPINEDDLLGREEVEVDVEQIREYVQNKRILVTGAGGSIGSELCKQLRRLDPAEMVMLDRDEGGLHATQLAIELRALLDSPSLVVADIRDRARMFEVFREWRPEVVFHAAALKHLTLLEQHPMEAVKTNVGGTRNVIDAAIEVGAECVVNVSTDKAANPTSVLGITKLMAEHYATEAADRTGARVVSVRFGNVLGSRGSVLPTFLGQIAGGGPVTVTHPDVTRYFMTIPEAVRLVLQAGAIGRSGEIMILDMGEPVRIRDLAQRLIDHHDPNVAIEFTGLRPGEKLHEILVADHEIGVPREHPRIMHTESVPTMDVDSLLGWFAGRPHVDLDELTTYIGQRQSESTV